jgi:hypothetical protein
MDKTRTTQTATTPSSSRNEEKQLLIDISDFLKSFVGSIASSQPIYDERFKTDVGTNPSPETSKANNLIRLIFSLLPFAANNFTKELENPSEPSPSDFNGKMSAAAKTSFSPTNFVIYLGKACDEMRNKRKDTNKVALDALIAFFQNETRTADITIPEILGIKRDPNKPKDEKAAAALSPIANLLDTINNLKFEDKSKAQNLLFFTEALQNSFDQFFDTDNSTKLNSIVESTIRQTQGRLIGALPFKVIAWAKSKELGTDVLRFSDQPTSYADLIKKTLSSIIAQTQAKLKDEIKRLELADHLKHADSAIEIFQKYIDDIRQAPIKSLKEKISNFSAKVKSSNKELIENLIKQGQELSSTRDSLVLFTAKLNALIQKDKPLSHIDRQEIKGLISKHAILIPEDIKNGLARTLHEAEVESSKRFEEATKNVPWVGSSLAPWAGKAKEWIDWGREQVPGLDTVTEAAKGYLITPKENQVPGQLKNYLIALEETVLAKIAEGQQLLKQNHEKLSALQTFEKEANHLQTLIDKRDELFQSLDKIENDLKSLKKELKQYYGSLQHFFGWVSQTLKVKNKASEEFEKYSSLAKSMKEILTRKSTLQNKVEEKTTKMAGNSPADTALSEQPILADEEADVKKLQLRAEEALKQTKTHGEKK